MFTFHPFSKIDWMAYSGAEPFSDGGEPLLSVGDVSVDDAPAEIVVDGLGVELTWEIDENSFSVRAEGAGGSRLLAMLRPRMTYADLVSAIDVHRV